MKRFLTKALKNALRKVPYFRRKIDRYNALKRMEMNAGFEIGHYYSPIPDLDEISARQDKIFADTEILDVDLNEEQQWKLLTELQKFYKDYPYIEGAKTGRNKRYRPGKDAFYRYSDAVFLFCMLRHFKPKKIIEVGSGHSTAIMLDALEDYPEIQAQCTFIDPNPQDRLQAILKTGDELKHRYLKQQVQDVDTDLFCELQAGDILFIDSTHVSKIGSDVNHLFFNVLPVLEPGVLVHIHDIFYPFEYPKEWIFKGKMYWNENYLLRAFLMNNPDYEIILFNTFLQHKHGQWFAEYMPECLINSQSTGSIWLRKK